MRILLINPKRIGRGQAAVSSMNSTPLALPILKALTPGDVDVVTVDENHEDIPFDECWDLVGITVMLHVSPAAIDIARQFRKRGVTVAFGGFFPTLHYEEARDQVDTVIAGEAEYIWHDVVGDLENHQLKAYYKADRLIDLKDIPFIKKDFFSPHDEFYHVETTRGCPHDCDFCSVTTFYGSKFRHRPIEHVMRQLEELKGKVVFFVDDNIAGNPKYASRLFREMIPLKIRWCGQFTLNQAGNREMMELAAESGCLFLFTGLETLSHENLQAVDKTWAKPEKYEQWIKMVQNVGIGIYGSFMFGFESDDKEVFKRTLDFCEKNEIELALFSALFPIKGSKFYQQLQSERRIFETDVSRFNGQHATFHPRKMTAQELENGLRWIWQTYYAKKSIKMRLSRLMTHEPPAVDRRGYPNAAAALLSLNMAFKVAVEDF